ncbi:hypothetical protein KAU11_07480 [Candidatus Babeliales bacterium]|nr:hypothetical protein [Candidatus Babeliales bacterium]
MWKRLIIVIVVLSVFLGILTWLTGVNFFGFIIIVPFMVFNFVFMVVGMLALGITIFFPIAALGMIPGYIKNGGGADLLGSYLVGGIIWTCSTGYFLLCVKIGTSGWYNTIFENLLDFCLQVH